MNKKILIFSALNTPLLPLISLSCVKNNEENQNYINKMIELANNQNLNLDQFWYLINQDLTKDKPIFKKIQKEKDQYYLITNSNKYQLNLNNTNYQYGNFDNDKNTYIWKENVNENTDLDVLFLNLFNPQSESFEVYIKKLWSKDFFNKNQYKSIFDNLPNLQWIAFKALKSNLLSNPYKINSQNARKIGFFNSDFQKSIFEKEFLMHLKAFKIVKNNQALSQIAITNWNLDENNNLSFNIDFLDEKNQSMLSETQKKLKIYLDDAFIVENYYKYRDLATNEFLSLNKNLVNKNISFFTEFTNQPKLSLKNNIFNFLDFDSIMHPLKGYEYFNLNGFKFLIENYPELFYLSNVSEDFDYKFSNFEISNLLNDSYSIGKLNVEITNKNDGNKQILPWFTINFNLHHHIFEGFFISNELGLINDKPRNSENYFSYYSYPKNQDNSGLDTNGNIIKPQFIDANDFMDENLIDIVNFLINQNINNLNLWKNKIMTDLSVEFVINYKDELTKKLELLLNQFILLYFIGDNQNKTLIKKVNVFIDPLNDYSFEKYGLGNLPISFSFIDENGNELLNLQNRQQIFLLSGFVGSNNEVRLQKELELKRTNNQNWKIEPLKDLTIPYLSKFDVN